MANTLRGISVFCFCRLSNNSICTTVSRTIYSKSRYALPQFSKSRNGPKEGKKEKKDKELDEVNRSPLYRPIPYVNAYKRKQKEEAQTRKQYLGRIRRCVEHGEIRKASSMFAEMKSQNIVPTTIFYNLMISGLVKARNSESALQFYDEMLDNGASPSARTFSSVFLALSQRGNKEGMCNKIRETLDLFRNSEHVSDPKSSLFVHNAAMKALVFCGDPLAAFEIYDDMVSFGVEPDDVTLSTLLLACQQDKENGMKKAVKVLGELFQKGVHMKHSETFNSFLLVCRDCFNASEFEDLLQLLDLNPTTLYELPNIRKYLDLADRIGCVPNLKTFQLLLYQAKSFSDIQVIIDKMEEQGLLFDGHFISTLVTRYLLIKEVGLAANVVQKYLDQQNSDATAELLEGIYKNLRYPYERFQIMMALEKLDQHPTSVHLSLVLEGTKIDRKQQYVEDVIKLSEERNLKPCAETLAFIETYTDALLKKRKVNKHYRYLHGWLEKWSSQRDIVKPYSEDKEFDHL